MASDSPLTIQSDTLLAEIDPLGAQLVRLSTRDGYDMLWDGDNAVWAGRAPILFPIVGALNQGSYRLDDQTFAMPKHGFARRSLFELIECSEGGATLAMQCSDETRAIFPFAFRLFIHFQIVDATLSMTAYVTNRDVRSMPINFGFHPALRWPLPFGAERAEHRVVFSSDEQAPVRRLDAAGLLEEETQVSPVVGRTLWLRDELFVEDAIIFDGLLSDALTYGAVGYPEIEIRFANLPHFGIWTKPGAGFVCLEPWQGFNDPVGFEGDLWAKPGIIAVAPGETKEYRMSLSLKGAPDGL